MWPPVLDLLRTASNLTKTENRDVPGFVLHATDATCTRQDRVLGKGDDHDGRRTFAPNTH